MEISSLEIRWFVCKDVVTPLTNIEHIEIFSLLYALDTTRWCSLLSRCVCLHAVAKTCLSLF